MNSMFRIQRESARVNGRNSGKLCLFSRRSRGVSVAETAVSLRMCAQNKVRRLSGGYGMSFVLTGCQGAGRGARK